MSQDMRKQPIEAKFISKYDQKCEVNKDL